MNNDDTTTKKQTSKREARAIALVLLAVGILALSLCVKWYIQSDWLKPGAAVNPDVINAMKGCIRVATFIIIPSLAFLLVLSSRLIWTLSKKLDDDKGAK
jgi:hypothetical protein